MQHSSRLVALASQLTDHADHGEVVDATVKLADIRVQLGDSAAAALLEDAGFRIEGPGEAGDRELEGCYWWTLTRTGWSGIECGPAFDSEVLARGDAVRALLIDEDLDWNSLSVRDQAVDQFPPHFSERMAWVLRDADTAVP